MPGIKDGLVERKELDTDVIKLIKRILRLKSIDRDRGTYSATGDSLDLSDDGQPSDDSRRPLGESARRSVSQDDKLTVSKFIIDKQVKGAIAENLAKNYFLNKGYLVFPNLTAQGCIDMVVINQNNEIIKIDVKSVSIRERDGYPIMRARSLLQKELDVKLFYVDIEKKECWFYKEHENHLKRRTKVEKI